MIAGLRSLDGRPLDPTLLPKMVRDGPTKGPERDLPASPLVALAQVGRQPHRSGDGTVAVVATGRIDDRDRLVRTLTSRGILDTDVSDDRALLLAAYRLWGPAFPTQIVGDFAIALWDRTEDRLILVRDPVGAQPLYVSQAGGLLRFASDPAMILADPAHPRDLDGIYLADYLTHNFRDHRRTIFAEISRLPPGHQLLSTPGAVSAERYWHPDRAPALHYRSTADYVAHFRELLQVAVSDRMRSASGQVAVMTSGGLDSTTVAALAQEGHRRGRHTARPQLFTEGFESVVSCDERAYTRELATHLDVEAHEILVEEHPIIPDEGWAPPLGSPAMAYEGVTHALLRKARAAGCDVLLTGYGGDSHFDAGKLLFHSHSRRGRWWKLAPFVQAARREGHSTFRALRAYLVAPLIPVRARFWIDRRRQNRQFWHVPPWLSSGLATRSGAEQRIRAQGYPRRYDDPIRQRQYEDIVGLAQQGHMMEWFASRLPAYGMTARFPLLDRRVSEFLLQVPLDLLAKPGRDRTKWLLRQATLGVLPETIRLRADKTSWDAYLSVAVREQSHERLERLFSNSRLAALNLVDEPTLKGELQRYVRGEPTGLSALHFLFPANLELWLRAHGSGAIRFDASTPIHHTLPGVLS